MTQLQFNIEINFAIKKWQIGAEEELAAAKTL